MRSSVSRIVRPAAEAAGIGDRAPPVLPFEALDDRVAIVGTAGSGKTYAAKGFVERLLAGGAHVAIVDPLGVWWGLRASADGDAPGHPIVIFGGRHADVPITAETGAALGRMIAAERLVSIVDLSELGSNTARRRFMAAFCEALYESNEEPLHLVLDEADLWAPQRPIKGWEGLLGHIEEIVRRGRVRGFVPWLISQRPAVVHKDVLSQADILIAMKLTASQDRDAIGAWIEGQADRQEGKRILGELPRLQRGEGYLWAPGHGRLDRIRFPSIRTFDSSRTPKRGERLAPPRPLAEIDPTAIRAALAAAEAADPAKPKNRGVLRSEGPEEDRRQLAVRERELAAAQARVAELEQENRALRSRLAGIATLAAAIVENTAEARPDAAAISPQQQHALPPQAVAARANGKPKSARPIRTAAAASALDGALHPAARKLLTAAAQHAPARFSWAQLATLAGLKPSGGHFNAGRKELRSCGHVAESNGLVTATPAGLKAAGEVPPAPSTPAERLALWCARLPSPAP
jgi:hypothetical protein